MERFFVSPKKKEALAFTASLILSCAVVETAFFGIFADFISMLMHELGHATIAWAGGRPALPLPLGFTISTAERVPEFQFITIATVIIALFYSLRTGYRALAVLLSCSLGALLYFGFSLHEMQLSLMIIIGGAAGELVLGTLLMSAFFLRLPDFFRWEYYRFIGLLMGTVSLINGGKLWFNVRNREESIPWGSGGMLSSLGSDGDMNRLRDVHGFTSPEIINTFWLISCACFVWVSGLALFAILKAWPVRKQWQPY